MNTIRNRWFAFLLLLCGTIALAGCTAETEQPGPSGGNEQIDGDGTGDDNTHDEDNDDGNDTTPEPPVGTLSGYADPDGVLILNQGAPRLENGTLTWIAPDGTVEEDIYGKVNGSAFGNTAQDLYMYEGKLYILSNNTEVPDEGAGEPGDGTLVVADAQTLRFERAFRFEELLFPRPEGSNAEEEFLPLVTPLENIAVLDERNVILSDSKGVYRFDMTTGRMTIIEGTYAFGNQGNTIESVVSTRGMVIIGDKIYCGGGGFWSSTKLFELAKDHDAVTRTLDLSGEFISGLCRTGDHEIVVATCGRAGTTKSYLTFVDTETWTVTLEKQIKADISAEFMNTSGVTLAGDYIYFAAGTLNVGRVSLKTWRVETNCIDVKSDVPHAQYLTCNVIADPERNQLYVSVSDDLGEAIVSPGNVLVYDCSGEEPQLVKNIANQASYPVNIYPMSRFQ